MLPLCSQDLASPILVFVSTCSPRTLQINLVDFHPSRSRQSIPAELGSVCCCVGSVFAMGNNSGTGRKRACSLIFKSRGIMRYHENMLPLFLPVMEDEWFARSASIDTHVSRSDVPLDAPQETRHIRIATSSCVCCIRGGIDDDWHIT